MCHHGLVAVHHRRPRRRKLPSRKSGTSTRSANIGVGKVVTTGTQSSASILRQLRQRRINNRNKNTPPNTLVKQLLSKLMSTGDRNPTNPATSGVDQTSLDKRTSIPVGANGTLMEKILPEEGDDTDEVLTSEDPGVDFDPASMLPTNSDIAKTAKDQLEDRVKAALFDLDQIIAAAGNNGDESVVVNNKLPQKVKSRMMMKFVLQISSKQSFVYEAELRHTTFYQNRLTYKFIMPVKDAVRLNSIYYRVTANVNVKTQNYGVRLREVTVTTKWSDGRADVPVDWPLKLSKKSKTGTYRVAGVEIKKSSRLNPENVIAVVTFSFNGW